MRKFLCLFVILVASLALTAQDVDNDRISITFNGDRAQVTLKDATANFAIGELVDAVRLKDFVKLDGELFYPLHVGNADGVMAVWWISSDGDLYYIGYCDGPAYEGTCTFENLTDAKKAMKKAMRDYYATNGTLDAFENTAKN